MDKVQRAVVKLILLCAVILVTTSIADATAYTYATDARWDNGLHATPSDTAGSRYNYASALGAPNATFLSLGLGGLAVFDFGTNFNAAAIIFETTNGNRLSYPEYANIYVAGSAYASTFAALNAANGLASISPSNFTFIKKISNQMESTVVDLSLFDGPFRYVLLQDASRDLGPGYDGFDVNAVGVTAVPEPGTMVLLGIGLAGVAVVSKRRNGKA